VQVEAAIAPYLDDGFLSLNIGEVQRAVTSLPWVERAGVRRSWPAALNVSVVEERAAARWGDNGLLNVYGELFVREATHVPAELPRLDGPDGTQLQVAKRFFDLDARLQQRGLTAVSLRLDARGSWQLGLSNGVVVRLGAANVDRRAARFFTALDHLLAPVTDQIDYVDMRYTNGFAVGWKENAPVRMAWSEGAGPNG
jgi:cell division protein FtsQ